MHVVLVFYYTGESYVKWVNTCIYTERGRMSEYPWHCIISLYYALLS